MTAPDCRLPPEVAIVLADILEQTVPGDDAQVEAFEKIGRVIAERFREHDGNGEGAADRRAHVDSEVSAGEHLGAAPTPFNPPPLTASPEPIRPYYGEHLDCWIRAAEISALERGKVGPDDRRIQSRCCGSETSIFHYQSGTHVVRLFCGDCGREYAGLAIDPIMTEDSRWAD